MDESKYSLILETLIIGVTGFEEKGRDWKNLELKIILNKLNESVEQCNINY